MRLWWRERQGVGGCWPAQWPPTVVWKSALPDEKNLPSVLEAFLGQCPEEEPPQGKGGAVHSGHGCRAGQGQSKQPLGTCSVQAQLTPRCTQGRWGGGRPPLFGWGALGTPRRVTVWEPPMSCGWRWGVCRPVSGPSSWSTPVSRALCHRPLGLLLLPVLGVGLIVVEVDRGLHRETGQHFLPGTLQVLSALWNGQIKPNISEANTALVRLSRPAPA